MSETQRDCKHGQLARKCYICELERELAAVTAERDSLRADAERYRWLRDEREDDIYSCHEDDGYGGVILKMGPDLDAAIDAAMKGE